MPGVKLEGSKNFMRSNLKVIAHRGASGYAPETTLAAYRLALQMGVDGIEMDVHPLRDGTIVAIHDPDVKRTTNGRGLIAELTLQELKALDAGSWFNKKYPGKARSDFFGLRVPTLQEIIELAKESSVEFYIEIKDPERYSPDLESTLLAIVRGNQIEKRTRFISFSAQSITKIKKTNPAIKTGLLIADRAKDPDRAALRISADELVIKHTLATHKIVDAAHKNGLSVSVWTANRQADLQRMMRLGVDCIITNYPDRLIRLLGREAAAPPS
jgi:glycerophosphoryl diester phosphodiesterase